MNEPLDLSIITVTFDSATLVGAALSSASEAAASAGLSYEVIVVDNASTDGSVAAAQAAVRALRVIRNEVNVGFGRANNQAFEVARGDTWLLLNPDATLRPDALGHLREALARRPGAAAVAPSIRGPGTDRGAESAGMQPGIRSAIGHFLFANRLLPVDRGGPWRGFQVRATSDLKPRQVEWASAAALLVRPSAIRAVGGFDPDIFMYGEDVELCRRLVEAGWTVWLAPAAVATHAIAGSQGGVTARWVDGLHRLHARRAGRASVVALDLIVAAGLAVRTVAGPIAGRGDRLHRRRMTVASRRAARLAIRSLVGRT